MENISKPKVSIIIPIWNTEKYLEKCLDSVVNQTLKDIEIICVDNGSTDSCPDIIQRFADNDERIKIITKNHGCLSSARNAGIAIATAPYITFVDSDDWIESECYANAVNEFEKDSDIDIVCWGANIINQGLDENSSYIKGARNYHRIKYTGKYLLNDNIILNSTVCVWNKLFKTDIVKNNNVLFPINVDLEDNSFYYTYISNCKYAFYIDKYLYNYVQRKNSTFERLLSGETEIIAPRIKNLIYISSYYVKKGIMDEKKNFIYKLLSEYFLSDYANAKDKNKANVISSMFSLVKLLFGNQEQQIKTSSKQIKISCIIPIYNSTYQLCLLLGALFNQTLTDIEIILIDDASDKITKDIISEYLNFDKRVTLVTNKTNLGQGYCRNCGIDNAKGEYLSFLDSDDLIDLNYFENLYTKAIEFNADIVSGKIRMKDLFNDKEYDACWVNYKKYKSNILITQREKLNNLYTNSSSSACKHLFKKFLINKYNIRFAEGYCHEDQIFNCKAFYYANKLVTECESSPIYYYYINKNSTTNPEFNSEKYTKFYFDQLIILNDVYDFLMKKLVSKEIIKDMIKDFDKIIHQAYTTIDNKHKDLYLHKVLSLQFGKSLSITRNYYYKKIIKTIFSIKNEGIRKVVTLFGIKFRFKYKKLIDKKRWQELNDKLNYTNELLQRQNQKYNESINSLNNKIDELNKLLCNQSEQIRQQVNCYNELSKISKAFQDEVNTKLAYAFDYRQMKFNILKDQYNLIIRDGTSDMSVFYQVFVDENYNYPYKHEPNIILDIGANVGYTAIYYAKLFPKSKIYCLEPDPDNYEILLKNIEKYPNIIPHNGALYSRDTILNIYDPNLGEWGLQVSETENNTAKEVQAYSFKSLLKLWGLENAIIDILKIDIEGSEKELFEGDVDFLDSVDLMIIETHDRFKSGTSQALFKVLQNKEFILNVKGEDLVFESKTYRSK